MAERGTAIIIDVILPCRFGQVKTCYLSEYNCPVVWGGLPDTSVCYRCRECFSERSSGSGELYGVSATYHFGTNLCGARRDYLIVCVFVCQIYLTQWGRMLCNWPVLLYDPPYLMSQKIKKKKVRPETNLCRAFEDAFSRCILCSEIGGCTTPERPMGRDRVPSYSDKIIAL